MEISLQEVPAQRIAYQSTSCAHNELGREFGRVLPIVGRAIGATMAGPPFGRYANWRESDCDVEIGAPVTEQFQAADGIEVGVLGGTRAAQGIHVGPYTKLPEAHHEMMTWISEQGLECKGPCWESYIDDPTQTPQDQLRTLIFYPV